MRKYEIMLILPPEADEEVVGRVVERISQVVQERGGRVESVDRWGKRRLAYEIHRHSEGNYVLVTCLSPPDALKEIDRVLSLADEVLRFKAVLRVA